MEFRHLVAALVSEIQSPAMQVKHLARDLDENGIKYCIIGGLALGIHNYQRSTEDIDALIAKEDFPKIKEKLIGRGYTLRPGAQKNMYMHSGAGKVPVDVLVEGDREASFTLPNPVKIRIKIGGVWYSELSRLIEFKLRADRPRDIQDVLQLIKANELTEDYVEKLVDKDVQEKFQQLFKK
jgi:hypothetical protein